MEVLEIYEFKLIGFSPRINFFNSLLPTTCGNIHTREYEQYYSDNLIASCDKIKSNSGTSNLPNDNNYENQGLFKRMYRLYQTFPCKLKSKDLEKNINLYKKIVEYDLIEFKKLINSYYKESYNPVLEDRLNKYSQNPIENSKESYILRIKSESSNIKLIIFGDLHGSFHSFFRSLIRLHLSNIIDLNTFKIDKNYKLIFLGDILDRGLYSFDIFYIILKLISMNDKNQIILNRGNHEDIAQNTVDGFLSEIRIKFGNDEIFYLIHKFLFTCPSAIIFEKLNSELIWLCHGGFPFLENGNLHIYEFENSEIILLNKEKTNQIQWSDFEYDKINLCNLNNINGRPIIYNKLANLFMQQNNIKLIIRGHQDNMVPSYFLSTMNNEYNALPLNSFSKSNYMPETLLNININTVSNEKNVDGPIATVNLKDLKFNNMLQNIKFFPILTVSSCNDNNKLLNRDGFIILNLNYNGIPTISTKNSGPIDLNINLIDKNYIS